MPVSKPFPSDADLARIQKENEYYQLYKSLPLIEKSPRMNFLLHEYFADDKEKLDLLYVAFNVAPLIVRTGTRFLFGKDVKIEIDEESDPERVITKKIAEIVKRNRLHRRFKESTKPFQYTGHTQFKVRKDPNGAVIEEIPFDQYFPDTHNLRPGVDPARFFIVAYMTSGEGLSVSKYIFVEEHEAKGITYRLFKNEGGKVGEQVPLGTLSGLVPASVDAKALDAFESNPLEEVTIVQIDGEKDVKDRMGESVFKPIYPLLHELNFKITQISLQMFKHLDPLLEIPEGSVPKNKDGTVKRRELEILFTQQGDTPSRYVTNDNPLIEEAFGYIKTLLQACALLTDTPPDFVTGSEKGGVEKVEALKTRFMPLLKRVEEYRSSYTEGIERVLTLALKLEKIDLPATAEFKITFDYGLPKDYEYDGMVWGKAYADGIASKETAVSRMQDISGKMLEDELAKIKEDMESDPSFGLNPVPPDPVPPNPNAA